MKDSLIGVRGKRKKELEQICTEGGGSDEKTGPVAMEFQGLSARTMEFCRLRNEKVGEIQRRPEKNREEEERRVETAG